MSDLRRIMHANRRKAVVLLIVLLSFYIVLPQLGGFRTATDALRHADRHYAAAAVAAVIATYLAAAGTYLFLAFTRLEYPETVLVEVAGNFVNRLLPAGIGSLGANYAYLRKSRHSKAQAITVVTANNTIGLIGHGVIVAVAVLGFRGKLQPAHLAHVSKELVWLAGVIVSVSIVIALLSSKVHARIRGLFGEVWTELAKYRHRPARLFGALMTSMSLTVCNVLSLWYCTQAIHAPLSFPVVLLIFSLGVGVGTATPSPGGLGGVEAGLIAGFIAYHVGSSDALAIALLFRLMSYWLPLAIGSVAFVACQKRGLFSSRY